MAAAVLVTTRKTKQNDKKNKKKNWNGVEKKSAKTFAEKEIIRRRCISRSDIEKTESLLLWQCFWVFSIAFMMRHNNNNNVDDKIAYKCDEICYRIRHKIECYEVRSLVCVQNRYKRSNRRSVRRIRWKWGTLAMRMNGKWIRERGVGLASVSIWSGTCNQHRLERNWIHPFLFVLKVWSNRVREFSCALAIRHYVPSVPQSISCPQPQRFEK